MAKHILIIDDDPAILEAVEILLQEDGYQVSTLKEARMLIAYLDAQQPDLILLDLLLSGDDGRDIAKQIKNHQRAKDIPVILMSADTHIKEKSQEAKADAFIKKPFDILELEALITSFLR